MTETARALPTARPGTAAREPSARCTPAERVTRSLLGYGVLAGPFYVLVSLGQAAARDGFDLRRHEWSLLANGPGGWVQVTNLIVTGLMVLAAAAGYGRALTAGVGARWAPRLLAVYGVGLVAAGLFRADPMNGFPVGTPDGPPASPSLHGVLHLATAGAGFVALIGACWLLARRYRREGRPGQAWFARLTGGAFLLGFAALASGASSATLNLTFTAAVILTWVWLSLTSLQQYKRVC